MSVHQQEFSINKPDFYDFLENRACVQCARQGRVIMVRDELRARTYITGEHNTDLSSQ